MPDAKLAHVICHLRRRGLVPGLEFVQHYLHDLLEDVHLFLDSAAQCRVRKAE